MVRWENSFRGSTRRDQTGMSSGSDEASAAVGGGAVKQLLVRAGYVLSGSAPTDVIRDGAIAVTDGVIEQVGLFEDLRRQYPAHEHIGGPRHIAVPGFVNAHQHGLGLSAVAMGYPDSSLEPWILRRLAPPVMDVYLDTLYAAIRMLRSGVTTAVHSHYYRTPDAYSDRIDAAFRAYRDAGLRVVFSPNITDKNHLVYGDDAMVVDQLPRVTRAFLEARAANGWSVSPHDYFALVDDLRRRSTGLPLVTVGYAPVGPQWCTDDLLMAIHQHAAQDDSPIHIHLLETMYQMEYGRRSYRRSLVQHLEDIGFLGPNVSCAHAVWISDGDIRRLRATGASVVHSPSSNLRLRSGIAPLNRLLVAGVTLGLGTDNLALNDDEDYLQEMRLAWILHRSPGIDRVPSAADIWRMATQGGATALKLGGKVGTLAPGKRADLLIVDLQRLSDLPAAETMSLHTQLIHFARQSHIDYVLVDGQVRVARGQVVGFDVAEIESELRASVRLPPRAARSHVQTVERAVQSYYTHWPHSVSGARYRREGMR